MGESDTIANGRSSISAPATTTGNPSATPIVIVVEATLVGVVGAAVDDTFANDTVVDEAVVGSGVAAVSGAGLPQATAMSAVARRSWSFLIMNILRISGMKRDRRPACGLHEQPFFRELIRGHRSGVLACPALTLRSVREASQLRDSAGFEPDFADSRGTPAVCPGYEECSDSTRSPQSRVKPSAPWPGSVV